MSISNRAADFVPTSPSDHFEPWTVEQLVREVSNQRTGGYDVEFDIKPNLEKARAGELFFLLIEIRNSEPGTMLDGEWWFDADGIEIQVL